MNTTNQPLEKLKEQLAYVYGQSNFYQKLFDEVHFEVSDITSVADLRKLPSVTKHELQKHAKEFWCVTPEKIVDYCNTSGTEGHPVTIPLTEKDLDRLALNEQLSLALTGGDDHEVYQLTTTIDRRFMAGMAYALGARKLGSGMIRLGPGLPELQWQTIEELNTTALIVVPSYLVKLIDYAKAHNIDYKKTSIKKAVCIGESIRNDDFSLNALGKRIKEAWDIELYSTYASTDMATAFTECEEGKGGHLLPDLVIAEILDDDDNEVGDGELGELTITHLGMEGMPLVRFRTGDICAMHHAPCGCGRNTPRLGPIVGRKHQMIKHKGTTCYPPAIFDVLDHIPEISHYQVEISADDLGNDHVIVKYAVGQALAVKELADHLRAGLRFTPELIALNEEDLKKLIYKPSSRKPVKLIDRRGL